MLEVREHFRLSYLVLRFISFSFLFEVNGGDINSIAKMRHLRTPDEFSCLAQSMDSLQKESQTPDACKVDVNILGSTSAKYSFLDLSHADSLNKTEFRNGVVEWKIYARWAWISKKFWWR